MEISGWGGSQRSVSPLVQVRPHVTRCVWQLHEDANHIFFKLIFFIMIYINFFIHTFFYLILITPSYLLHFLNLFLYFQFLKIQIDNEIMQEWFASL